MDPSTLIALGLLTQSKTSSRFRALTNTWLPHFQPYVMVFESHTDVSRVQQIWKYILTRLYKAFPSMRFYLILDDDVFINRIQLLRFLKHRDHHELALYGPGFCEWGVSSDLKKQISSAISDVKLPQMMHIVIGGIMLFTSAAVKQFSDATVLMQCIDDLETLFANKIHLWDGLKDSAMYNQDWLFCWCLQVRMGGKVHLENAFEDVEFPQRKCLSVTEGARQQVGIHHTNPKRMHALWRAYERWAVKESGGSSGNNLSSASFAAIEANAALHSPHDPSRVQECRMDPDLGRPYAHLPWRRRRRIEKLPKPSAAAEEGGKCHSTVLSDPNSPIHTTHPQCASHMRYVKQHPGTSPCFGPFGREACEGFQLDRSDNCNVQYYLFCERLYKPVESYRRTARSWCPPPEGYPKHCCYGDALDMEMVYSSEAAALAADGRQGFKKRGRTGGGSRPPGAYLLQVYPERPVFQDKEEMKADAEDGAGLKVDNPFERD